MSALPVTDLERSRYLYREVFGREEITRPPCYPQVLGFSWGAIRNCI
jgi:catechol 2,3-dioxygenase-like lactoylglutathione lyase family enzyme